MEDDFEYGFDEGTSDITESSSMDVFDTGTDDIGSWMDEVPETDGAVFDDIQETAPAEDYGEDSDIFALMDEAGEEFDAENATEELPTEEVPEISAPDETPDVQAGGIPEEMPEIPAEVTAETDVEIPEETQEEVTDMPHPPEPPLPGEQEILDEWMAGKEPEEILAETPGDIGEIPTETPEEIEPPVEEPEETEEIEPPTEETEEIEPQAEETEEIEPPTEETEEIEPPTEGTEEIEPPTEEAADIESAEEEISEGDAENEDVSDEDESTEEIQETDSETDDADSADITEEAQADQPQDMPEAIALPEDIQEQMSEETGENISTETPDLEENGDLEAEESAEITADSAGQPVSAAEPESQEPAAEPSAMDNMTEYMAEHNYGQDDFAEYSQDPEWQRLNNELLQEQEIPPTAEQQMYEYMAEHNYGYGDYPEYSQDPEWQRIHDAYVENPDAPLEVTPYDERIDAVSPDEPETADTESAVTDVWAEETTDTAPETEETPEAEETEGSWEADVAQTIEETGETEETEETEAEISEETGETENEIPVEAEETAEIEETESELPEGTDETGTEIPEETEEAEETEETGSELSEETDETGAEISEETGETEETEETESELPEGTEETGAEIPEETGETEETGSEVPEETGETESEIPEEMEAEVPEIEETGEAEAEIPEGTGEVEAEIPEGTGEVEAEIPEGTGEVEMEIPEGTGEVEMEIPEGTGEVETEIPEDTAQVEEIEEVENLATGYYEQGVNDYGFEGTCGPTSIANGLNRMLGENRFTENDVLTEAINENLCYQDPDSPMDSGGTTTDQFIELYEHMNDLCEGGLDVERFDFDNVLSMEEVADRLDEGSVIHVAVDADTLWGQSTAGMMGTPEIDKATDHWITVTGAERGENGEITGFHIVDSGGGVDYVDADTYQAMCYGSESLHLDDPTCIVVSKHTDVAADAAADIAPDAQAETADVPTGTPADVAEATEPEAAISELRETSPFFENMSDERLASSTASLERMSDTDRQVYLDAVRAEPEITKDVTSVFDGAGGTAAGLDYRIKTPESLTEKLYDRPEARDISQVSDILRYTETLSPAEYAEGANRSLEMFEEKGYTVEEVDNRWLDENNPYQGINVKLVSPEGQKLEVQFHTEESFELKNGEMHELYEQWRNLPEDSEEAIELQNRMFALSRKLEVPQKISEVRKS